MIDIFTGSTLLSHLLKAYSPIALAFSGGLDSRFLAYMMKKVEREGVRAHLYFFRGPHISTREYLQARDWAKANGLPFSALMMNPLELEEIRNNGQERCYHCKRLLFTSLRQAVTTNPPFPGESVTLCDGSNLTDRQGYRPGQRALHELSVHSPLAETGFTKEDIHYFAAELGMDNPDQHARPCLLTRYDYNLPASEASLTALDRAEERIAHLFHEAVERQLLSEMPDYRLRLVSGPENSTPSIPPSDFDVELHSNAPQMPEKLRQDLTAAVEEQGFAPPRFCRMVNVSGFYDAGKAT